MALYQYFYTLIYNIFYEIGYYNYDINIRGGHRGLKLENHYCIRVSGCLTCGEYNAKKIEAPPLWEK